MVSIKSQSYDIAARAHDGQKDKAGEDYIKHCTRVATTCERFGDKAYAVAMLHDVIEDRPQFEQEIIDNFPHDIYEALCTLNRNNFADSDSYYAAIRDNPLALIVKLADIQDNSDEKRLAKLDQETAQRLRNKYQLALRKLGCEFIFNVANTPHEYSAGLR